MNSKLYQKAGKNNSVTVKSKIIKLPKNDDNINHDFDVITNKKKENSTTNENVIKTNSNIRTKLENKQSIKSENIPSKRTKLPLKNTPYFKNKLIKKSQISEFLKEIYIRSISMFLDAKSIFNLMNVNKKFYKSISDYDEIWYRFYYKKFKTGKYETNRSNWKKMFLNSVTKLYNNNLISLQTKFLTKYKKNAFCARKDPYYISYNLYSFLKPIYKFSIDGHEYPVKLVFKSDILSHINFFTNFDSEYINLNKIKKIILTLSENNLGFNNRVIYTYEMKKNALTKMEDNGIKSKILKIYSYKEFLVSTFEENYIFFINISIPICKICEVFDFLNGIHGRNLDYSDDIDKNFGLYDYSLLLNIKNNSELFFNININTIDLKNLNWDEEYYHFENKNQVVTNTFPQFNIRTIALEEKISNLLILDILLLNDRGDHMICESFPMILTKTENVDFEFMEYENYSTTINTMNFSIQLFFRFLHHEKLYIFDKFSFKIKKEFVKGIYKKI